MQRFIFSSSFCSFKKKKKEKKESVFSNHAALCEFKTRSRFLSRRLVRFHTIVIPRPRRDERRRVLCGHRLPCEQKGGLTLRKLMVSFRHKMGFLCQAGAMNSFGDAALLILQRTGARAPQLPPPPLRPPALRAGILIKANCRLPSGQSCLRDTKTEGEARRRPVLICWFSPFYSSLLFL